jgi:putative membrane protein
VNGGTWQRLDPRMIGVDAVQGLLSLTPISVAVGVFDVEPRPGTLGPAVAVAVLGAGGAALDALRWAKTRYRITDQLVERRTGLVVHKYRSIRRDRIRSVDTTAKLRHRLAGLRVVTIGAGQQPAAGEPALLLDAVSRQVAERLRERLLVGDVADPGPAAGRAVPERAGEQVLARFRWQWIVHNIFSIWAYLAAAGVLWGAYWLARTFGMDPAGFVADLVDWRRLGWGWSVLIGAVTLGAVGVAILAVSFVTDHWGFRLARVRGRDGTVLRTTEGLFKTRQVDRDQSRLRGVQIGEPLLWRWLGTADTDVISTGLKVWSMHPATTILPRGPVTVARRVAAEVLGEDPSPLAAPLPRHPRTALRRRLVRALLITGGSVAGLAWLAAVGPLPGWAPVAGLGLLPPALAGAVVAYRALGHALAGDYWVVRSGLLRRSTAAVQTRAVVGWRIRQSLLQRRLGLVTLIATTGAGVGEYQAPDLDARLAVVLADRAVPGLLGPFRHHQSAPEYADV